MKYFFLLYLLNKMNKIESLFEFLKFFKLYLYKYVHSGFDEINIYLLLRNLINLDNDTSF